MAKLGVNIDHVATLRQARREFEPDPVAAAKICERAGANSIVAHLREDRRHINDKDILALRKQLTVRFNMEMSIAKEIVAIACKIKPDQATLVPERRQEITTEGGLDVNKNFIRVKEAVGKLNDAGIEVSLFIAPSIKQIEKSISTGAKIIEFHTGKYALATNKTELEQEFKILKEMTRYAIKEGLIVNAGHGLKYDNVKKIAQIDGVEELNIGHSIISRAVFVGIEQAVREMIELIK